MRLKDARPQAGSKHRRRRLGRGISAGQGASGGLGMRGQKARAGSGPRPGFEGGQNPLYRRLPKLKHFPLVNRQSYTTINVRQLANLAPGTEVTLEQLVADRVITGTRGPLKVLGDGDLTVSLRVKAAAFTASARAKITGAGGQCEDINPKS